MDIVFESNTRYKLIKMKGKKVSADKFKKKIQEIKDNDNLVIEKDKNGKRIIKDKEGNIIGYQG